MNTRTARRAERARGTGWRARRAMRWLLRAGDGGDADATDALWDVWLDRPVDEVWAALSRWRRPHTAGGASLVALGEPAATLDVVAAAGRAGHPVADTARAAILDGPQELVDAACAAALTDDGLAAFCAEHHLAPADPHRAAVFFLLTGQLEKYRLADPDHSLVALAYRTAPEDERARIRQRAAGEPDLVRALAETVRKNGLAGVTEPEARYLVESLAERRDWPALWELAKGLPVHHAAAAVARFDGWLPDGDDLGLFDVLLRPDPAALTTSWAAVATPWTAHEAVAGAVIGGSIGPDGQGIAVATTNTVEVFRVRRGALASVGRRQLGTVRAVLMLDEGRLIVGGTDLPGGKGYLEHRGRRLTTGRPVTALARVPKGFTALLGDQYTNVAVYRATEHPGGGFAQLWRTHDVAYRLGSTAAGPDWQMATDPGSGRIALTDGEHLYLTRKPGALSRMASTPFRPDAAPCLTFCGPNQLAGVDVDGVLRMWRREGRTLVVAAEWPLGAGDGPACPVYLPDAGVVAVIEEDGLRCFDVLTGAEASVPDRLVGPPPTFLSADGGRLMIGGDRRLTVTDARLRWDVTELAAKPLAAITPADVRLVSAQLRRRSTDPDARPFLELLHACMVRRFGTDIALGAADALTAWADDIALGGDE